MTIGQIIILSIVEGITEFIPVSSTAHLEFTSKLLGIVQSDFLGSFIIAIQVGAILAVVWLYRRKIFLSKGAFLRMIVGFIPTGIIGFALYSIIKNFLLGNWILAGVVLVLGGIVMLWMEHWITVKQPVMDRVLTIEDLSYKDMLWLGVIQSLAVIPGISRSGALIVGGLAMRIPRTVIVETAFLLAVPTMIVATAYDLLKSGFEFSGLEWQWIGWGALFSGIIAYVVARWLIDYVRHASFRIFGWYRIVAGIIFLIIFYFVY